jgi:hypothetical protein
VLLRDAIQTSTPQTGENKKIYRKPNAFPRILNHLLRSKEEDSFMRLDGSAAMYLGKA